MMHRVMPRRSWGSVPSTTSASGCEPSACTLASRCRIFCSTRGPRSGVDQVRAGGRGDPDRPVSARVWTAIEAAAADRRLDRCARPSPACAERSRSSSIHRSAACSRSNSFTCSSPWRTVDEPMDAVDRVAVDVRTHGADHRRRGLVSARAPAWCRRPARAAGASAAAGTTSGKTTTPVGLPDHHLAREEAERVAGANPQRAEPIASAPQSASPSRATGGAPGLHPDDAAGEAHRQVDSFHELDPRLRPARLGCRPGRPPASELADLGPRIEHVVAGPHAA